MPTQNSLIYNHGVVSAAIFGVKKGGTGQLATRAYAKQGFTSVSNTMLDVEDHTPIAAPTPKAGDCLNFELVNDHDLTTFVDFCFTLPGLNPAGVVNNPIYNTSIACNFAQQPGNFVVDVGIDYSDVGTWDAQNSRWSGSFRTATVNNQSITQSIRTGEPRYRYRIPSNPGSAGLMNSDSNNLQTVSGLNYEGLDLVNTSDYAVLPGGYPNPGYNRGVGSPDGTSTKRFVDLGGYMHADDNVVSRDSPSPYSNAVIPSFFWSFQCPNPIWVDYVGYYILEQVKVIHGTNQVQIFSGVDMWKMNMKWHNQETTEHYRVMTGGHQNGPGWDITDVQYASYARQVVVPMDLLFWIGKITEALPIVGSAKPLQIKIKLRDPQYLYLFQKVDTSITSDFNGSNPLNNNALVPVPIPLRDVRLRVHKVYVPKSERATVLHQLDSDVGFTWKCFDLEQQNDIRLTFSQHKNSATVQLLAFKGAATTVMVTKIHSLDKQTPFATFWTNFLRIGTIKVDSGKDSVIPLLEHFYLKNRTHILYNNAKLNNYNIYAYNYSLIPSDKFNAWGHLEYGNLHNPTMTLTYPVDHYNPRGVAVTTTSGTNPVIVELVPTVPTVDSTGSPVDHPQFDHILDIVNITHQFVNMKSGEINRVFH